MKKGGTKTMTDKQLAANRNNAQKSTGPISAAGKSIAKMNALKHGLLATEVVVRGLHYKESPREFRAYRQRCWQELAPVGPLETALVDELVTNRWRRRRILIAESGEIALSADRGWWRRNYEKNDVEIRNWMRLGITAMEKSWGGVRYLMDILEGLRDAVQKEGELTEAALSRALESFANKPNHLIKELADFRRLLQENPDRVDSETLRTKHQQQVLGMIERNLRMLDRRLDALDEREISEEKESQAASVLPSAETLDKILRYETTLDRQFYRAMNQLERLQRIRGGEQVPAPVTMEISARG